MFLFCYLFNISFFCLSFFLRSWLLEHFTEIFGARRCLRNSASQMLHPCPALLNTQEGKERARAHKIPKTYPPRLPSSETPLLCFKMQNKVPPFRLGLLLPVLHPKTEGKKKSKPFRMGFCTILAQIFWGGFVWLPSSRNPPPPKKERNVQTVFLHRFLVRRFLRGFLRPFLVRRLCADFPQIFRRRFGAIKIGVPE